METKLHICNKKIISKIFNVLVLFCLFLFLSSAGFRDSKVIGWYQQWITNLNGSTIKDMTFLDSLTGFAVTTTNSSVQAYILKTTNGGDNWSNIYTYVPPSVNSGFRRIIFTNNNVGYASTNYYDFFKTTNAGLNWIDLSSVIFSDDDMAVINVDTIICVSSSGFDGGVYRSTNGGLNWQRIWFIGGGEDPSKIYMYDKNMGFSCQPITGESRFRKTTNGGFNWIIINDTNFRDIKFVDTLIGYKVFNNSIKKSTDGGINWIRQTPPKVFSFSGLRLSLINKDTVWFAGPTVLKNSFPYGVICKTTNGGLNWGYQIPDTSIRISNYPFVIFIGRNNGWAYQDSNGVHTKVGGNDTTIYTNISEQITNISEQYRLFQNYPNPFNPSTVISYSLLKNGYVVLKIYDILGNEITTLVNKNQKAGKYEVQFSNKQLTNNQLPSGIYFYSLFVDEVRVDTKKMLLVK
jgi:photosystem II stability/assembly factor-like uncharacterized protein